MVDEKSAIGKAPSLKTKTRFTLKRSRAMIIQFPPAAAHPVMLDVSWCVHEEMHEEMDS